MSPHERRQREILQDIAHRVMLEKGLLPEFSDRALAELKRLPNGRKAGVEGSNATAGRDAAEGRDLRDLAWCSIDNDDSRDLDQLSFAQALADGTVRILVAIADVDHLVPQGCAIDEHARHNTTSVYTAAQIFPMLPEKLSTDLTSLNFGVDRQAMVVEMAFTAEGELHSSDIYRALVRNRAKLAYNGIAAWLEGGMVPQALASVPDLDRNLKLQDAVAQKLKALRHTAGALNLQTIEARPVFAGDDLRDLAPEAKNRAKDIIEDFMIAANGVAARYLAGKKLPSLRRVVRTPKRWERIVDVAAERNFALPSAPDAKALEQFLLAAKAADPVRFPDLSLTVIKLMGAGEYIVEAPGGTAVGHFGLAVRDYTHSTAPNRRYPDLITQRLLKAAIALRGSPYGDDELRAMAQHCTQAEDAAKKVERQVQKSAAAMLLENRIGERFDAIVTGAADKGTWVRLFALPIEGRLAAGFQGADVGDKLRVQLVHTDVERGHIDFKRVP